MRIKVRPERCVGCRSCEMACSGSHSPEGPKTRKGTHPRIMVKYGQVKREGRDKGRPHIVTCRHCAKPKCADACISGAIYVTNDGKVLYDPEKCVGCWMCIMVCPFGAIGQDLARKRIVKCDLCHTKDGPACVEACKVKALELDDGLRN